MITVDHGVDFVDLGLGVKGLFSAFRLNIMECNGISDQILKTDGKS